MYRKSDTETWSGAARGRKPKWVVDAQAAAATSRSTASSDQHLPLGKAPSWCFFSLGRQQCLQGGCNAWMKRITEAKFVGTVTDPEDQSPY